MVTLSHINDSRAVFRVAIGARVKETKQMDNLSKAIALLDSNPELREMINRLNHPLTHKTPPATLRDIVDAIAATRGVTLYRESMS